MNYAAVCERLFENLSRNLTVATREATIATAIFVVKPNSPILLGVACHPCAQAYFFARVAGKTKPMGTAIVFGIRLATAGPFKFSILRIKLKLDPIRVEALNTPQHGLGLRLHRLKRRAHDKSEYQSEKYTRYTLHDWYSPQIWE